MLIKLLLIASILFIQKPILPNKIEVHDDIRNIIKYYKDMGHVSYAYEGTWVDTKDTAKPIIVIFFRHVGSGPKIAAGKIYSDSGINTLLVSLPDEIEIRKK